MIRIIYNLLLIAFFPFWFLWMIQRAKKRNESPNWKQRWGNYDIPSKTNNPRIWIHAVSVGEVSAAKPILKEIKKRLHETEIILSCTTSTGFEMGKKLLGETVNHIIYFPIDLPFVCKKALATIRPDTVVIMETELWMNFLWASKSFGAKTFVANGRLSDRSFQISKKVAFFYRALFKYVDEVLVQTQKDAQRFERIGAKNIHILGNSKYDEALDLTKPQDWKSLMNMKPEELLIVVGSARGEFEEDFILDAISGIQSRILFAPRHIERATEIQKKATEKGFECSLKSTGNLSAQLVILDTYGELASTYHSADVVIIGGGFDKLGGQNIIQPLAAGKPVICGPHMFNFREAFDEAKEVGAIIVASTPQELKLAVEQVLQDEDARLFPGEAARNMVAKHRGASARIAGKIIEAIEDIKLQQLA